MRPDVGSRNYVHHHQHRNELLAGGIGQPRRMFRTAVYQNDSASLPDRGSQVAKEHYGAWGWGVSPRTPIHLAGGRAPMDDGPPREPNTTWAARLVHACIGNITAYDGPTFLKEATRSSKDRFVSSWIFGSHLNGKWLVTNPSTRTLKTSRTVAVINLFR